MEGHINIYGEIGWEVTAESVQNLIKDEREKGDVTEWVVNMSSFGGGVFEGWAIGNIIAGLKEPTTCLIQGFCGSIATFIALSCKKVEIFDTGRFMIHNSSTMAAGNKEDMETMQEELEKIDADLVRRYVNKTNLPEDEIKVMMEADKGQGTNMTAQEALDMGFVDEIVQALQAVAKFDGQKFIKMPNTKEVDSKDLGKSVFNHLKNWEKEFMNSFRKFYKNTVENITVQLADGGAIFVESEDGEFEGKPAFTVDEDGEKTETPVSNGTHVLTDGRSLTIEDGVVVSVQEESPEDELKKEIEALKAQLAEKEKNEQEFEKLKEETEKEVSEMKEDIQNLLKSTAGDNTPPLKTTRISNKFDDPVTKGHPLDGFAEHLNSLKK